MTERLARACALRPWRTLGAWLLAIVVALAATAVLLPGNLTTEGTSTNNPESLQAYKLMDERLPQTNQMTELVVVRSGHYTVDDPAFRAKFDELYARGEATGVIAAARDAFHDHDASLISSDRHATLVPLRLQPPEADSAETLIAAVQATKSDPDFEVGMTGKYTTNHDFSVVSQSDLKSGELRFGLPAALIVLVLVFGALVAAGLPLALAIVSILVGLGLTAVVASVFELSVFVVNMLTAMGLALGIDYALFIVSRFREERAAGREKVAAIAAAGATASRAVLFSGTAFVFAMLGLLLVQSSIMRSLAVGAILVAVASVAGALTLLPAVLSLLGDRVNALHVPLVGRRIAERAGEQSRFWGAVCRAVVRRPAASFAAAAALLLAAALPAFGMKIGAAGIGSLPDNLIAKQGMLALERSFPAAGADPAKIVVDGDVSSPAVRQAIGRLKASLAGDPDFGPVSTQVAPAGDLAVLRVEVSADALSKRALAAVKRLRASIVPAAFAGAPQARALVTGVTAENIDYFDVMSHWLPIVFVFVLGLSFLLLTVVFRSIVIAATAVVVNLLSVGAAYGIVVGVFQNGFAAGLLGFRHVDTIEAWVPLFLFAVLFGLSMDYQVFLLSRIRERFAHSGDTIDAVSFGIGSTARIITGAALIIVVVFLGFAAGDLVMFQQMGFGVAVALLIDATIVRSVLVPAAMALLGTRNWYLPRVLGWLPHVEVEGHAVEAPAADPG